LKAQNLPGVHLRQIHRPTSRLTGPGAEVSDQTLIQALQQNVFGQIDADEDHFAHFDLTFGPNCP
jgi:hypothetical protein